MSLYEYSDGDTLFEGYTGFVIGEVAEWLKAAVY
jgi:hypothetical protein